MKARVPKPVSDFEKQKLLGRLQRYISLEVFANAAFTDQVQFEWVAKFDNINGHTTPESAIKGMPYLSLGFQPTYNSRQQTVLLTEKQAISLAEARTIIRQVFTVKDNCNLKRIIGSYNLSNDNEMVNAALRLAYHGGNSLRLALKRENLPKNIDYSKHLKNLDIGDDSMLMDSGITDFQLFNLILYGDLVHEEPELDRLLDAYRSQFGEFVEQIINWFLVGLYRLGMHIFIPMLKSTTKIGPDGKYSSNPPSGKRE